MQDKAVFWRIPEFHGLEFLKATSVHHSYARHWHETFVIQVVEFGVNGLYCAGSMYSVPAASILVINPGDVHTGFAEGDRPMSYRSVYPLPELMPETPSMPSFRIPVISDPHLASRFLKAHRKFETGQDSLQAQSLLLSAIADLVSGYSDRKPRRQTPEGPVHAAKEFLLTHYQKQTRLEDLAGLCGFSPYYFLRAFRKTLGLPPFEFLTNIRVERAKELLAKGLSISESAQLTGFYDQSHLHRHFKRIAGVTPGQYRARSYNTTTIV